MFHPSGRDQGRWTIIPYPSLALFLGGDFDLPSKSMLKPGRNKEKKRIQKWRQSPQDGGTTRSYKKKTGEVIIHGLRVCEKGDIPPPS